MKKIKSILVIIVSVIVVSGIAYAGSLTSPSTISSQSYTLSDIYNKMMNISYSPVTHTVSTTTAPAPSFRTLTEIYSKLNTEGNLITPGNIREGVTIFGVRGDLSNGGYSYPASPLKTGITKCYNPNALNLATVEMACGATFQDGETKYGVVNSLVDNGDNTVTDNSTGLMWIRDPLSISNPLPGSGWGTNISFTNALTKCNVLNTTNYAGRSGWRLPNIRELQTIVYFGRMVPSIDIMMFPNTKIGRYWSSTMVYNGGHSVSDMGPSLAWYVEFVTGVTATDFIITSGDSNVHYVRCVRSI